MASDYRRGGSAATGPRTLGVIGGIRQDGTAALVDAEGKYAEAQLDDQGCLRVALGEEDRAILQGILEQLTLQNELMAAQLEQMAD